MDGRNLSICCRKGNLGEMEKSEDLFQEGVRCTEEWDTWRGKDKSHKYFYFDQLLFLLHHLEDRETQSKLSTRSNEDEEEVNNSQEEKELPCNIWRKKQTTAEALADSLEAQFQPVTVPLVPAVPQHPSPPNNAEARPSDFHP